MNMDGVKEAVKPHIERTARYINMVSEAYKKEGITSLEVYQTFNDMLKEKLKKDKDVTEYSG